MSYNNIYCLNQLADSSITSSADSYTTTPDPDQPADSSTTTPDPLSTGQFNSSALGGALGGCVFLLLIVAVIVGVVIVVIRSKKYIRVQENRAYHNRNPTYQPEGGKHNYIEICVL